MQRARLRFERRAFRPVTDDGELRLQLARQRGDRVDEISDAFALRETAHEQHRTRCLRAGERREGWHREIDRVGNHLDRDRRHRSHLRRRAVRDGDHAIGRRHGAAQKSAQHPERVAHPSELDAVEMRDDLERCRATGPRRPSEDRVRHGPVHMHDVEPPPAAESPRGDRAEADVAEGHAFVQQGPLHPVRCRLFVGQVFPPREEVAKPVDRDPSVLGVAAAAVRRREHLELISLGRQAPDRLDEPLGRGIVLVSGERGRDDENAHGSNDAGRARTGQRAYTLPVVRFRS